MHVLRVPPHRSGRALPGCPPSLSVWRRPDLGRRGVMCDLLVAPLGHRSGVRGCALLLATTRTRPRLSRSHCAALIGSAVRLRPLFRSGHS